MIHVHIILYYSKTDYKKIQNLTIVQISYIFFDLSVICVSKRPLLWPAELCMPVLGPGCGSSWGSSPGINQPDWSCTPPQTSLAALQSGDRPLGQDKVKRYLIPIEAVIFF